jgi:hypothetical protein
MSKALKLQQETEDHKNGCIISKLENKVEGLQGSLEEKDIGVQSFKADLAEAKNQTKA